MMAMLYVNEGGAYDDSDTKKENGRGFDNVMILMKVKAKVMIIMLVMMINQEKVMMMITS